MEHQVFAGLQGEGMLTPSFRGQSMSAAAIPDQGNSMIAAFVANPVKVIVGVLLVVLFGLIGLDQMPKQLTPEVEIPTITVTTRWPGASPQEVERQIVMEQEEQLKSVEGVTKLTSECMDSMATITLEFAIGTNMQEALLKVNTKLQQVSEYPEDAKEPVISTTNSGNRPIAWFILKPLVATPEQIAAFIEQHPETREALERAMRSRTAGLRLKRLKDAANEHPVVRELLPPPDLDVPTFRKFAEDNIEARFERVPGVADAEVLGGREEEMQVVVDPQKLAARQLTIQDVRAALRGQNQDTSGGDIWENKRRYVVRTLGQFRSPKQVEEAILARRDGQPVYVRDVAEVQLGYKKPDGMVMQFGQPCIAINAKRAVGANVLQVMEGLRQANRELNEGLLKPQGLYLEQVYDETEYINSSINLVENNIVIGGLLTVATLLLFLRSGRSTFVIALAIPVSIIGTFLVMSLMGRTLNVVSLAGLAFAVGMLVDNAVVVLENIFQHYQRGESPFRSAVAGASEVWGAVLSSTLTTVAVFLPVLFVKEEAGQLFRDIALAISAGVLLSLVVSLTLIPMASARLLTEHGTSTTTADLPRQKPGWQRLLAPIDWFGAQFLHTIIAITTVLQRSVLLRFGVVAGCTFAAVGISVALMPKVEYLPNGNQNLVFGILLPPPGYNLNQLTEIGARIEERMRPYWDVDPGEPAAAELRYPPIRDFFYVARGRSLFMGLKSTQELRAGAMVGLIRELAGDIPGMFAIGKQASLFEQGLTAGRTIDVEISGPELPKLIGLGVQVIKQVPTVVPNSQPFPKPSLDLASPEIHVIPKWDQAADLGISAVDLGYTVDALVDGAYATDYYKDGVKIDLTIKGDESFAGRTQDVQNLPVATPSGELIPLRSVAEVKLASGPEQINRRQRQRAITIQVAPPPEMPLEEAMQRIQQQIVEPIIASGQLEGGLYRIELAGTADKLRTTWLALSFNLFLALVITYLLMAALFESWLYPLVIIFSVPLGAAGGFIGLAILNQFVLQPLDILTMLGFVILIGTVVNNPILIVEQALILIRRGQDYRQAIVAAVRSRVRPIFMTTMTTLLGLLPLVVIPGAGSELYRGLGAVLLGGLLVSTLVTLIVIPSMFTLTLQVVGWMKQLWPSAVPLPAEETVPALVSTTASVADLHPEFATFDTSDASGSYSRNGSHPVKDPAATQNR